MPPPIAPNACAAYTIVLLHHAGRYLLLQRAATKRFAPGRWTGIGGLVEPHELTDLRAAALRELEEESGIREADIAGFYLRRVLLHARQPGPLTVLLYFTGELGAPVLPPCPEGTLAWVAPTDFESPHMDIIETARPVLTLLVADAQRDPEGLEPVWLGAVRYRADGSMAPIVWA